MADLMQLVDELLESELKARGMEGGAALYAFAAGRRAQREHAAALRAAAEGYFLVPIYPSGDWVRSVMRPWEPAINEGGRSWRRLEGELLHCHALMLAAHLQEQGNG